MTEFDKNIPESSVKEVNSELEDLLANPFSDATAPLSSTPQAPLQESSKEAVAPRLVDRLPKERQVQAQALAEQIDVGNAQAIMSYGALCATKIR